MWNLWDFFVIILILQTIFWGVGLWVNVVFNVWGNINIATFHATLIEYINPV